MLALALPVVLGELGWMTMGVVDTLMVGRVGVEAIGAVSIGRALFFTVTIGGIGLLLGLDTLVSTAYGARRLGDCHAALIHGVWLSLALGLPATLLIRAIGERLADFGIDPDVAAVAPAYVRAVAWSALPLLLYTTCRRYLQGVSRVRPVMVALVSANVVNALGNWILIYGHLGAPALGVAGAGWATSLASWYLALFLAGAVLLHDREERGGLTRAPLRIARRQVGLLLRLGLPAAGQLLLEMGVFAAATALVGRLDATSLAAHQIALTTASVTFMVPLGVSSAGAVRVGQALGRGDLAEAQRAGWAALALGAGFMILAGAVLVAAPRSIARLYTADAAVIAAGASLLVVAAAFQLFDGLQVVATGVLRGAGDTRTPFAWNLLGHWLLGLPLGTYLCFARDLGAVGLWIGLLAGLGSIGSALLLVWWRKSRTWGVAQDG